MKDKYLSELSESEILFTIKVYTPKHGSWLNVAEIEISILQRQCLNRRIPDKDILGREVTVWADNRNKRKKGIEWSFTKKKAAAKFKLDTQQN